MRGWRVKHTHTHTYTSSTGPNEPSIGDDIYIYTRAPSAAPWFDPVAESQWGRFTRLYAHHPSVFLFIDLRLLGPRRTPAACRTV